MRGEQVTVRTRTTTGFDAFNNPIVTATDMDVDDVLVQSPANSDAPETTRPDGFAATITLQFPRSYDGPPLEGAEIVVRGIIYRVIGAPLPLDGGMTPTRWNMTVTAARSEG